jgi:dethiobiotin synthetase
VATFFVTGTDTGVGKTYVSCLLLREARSRGLSCAGFKPVAAGCELTPDGLRNDDALALQAAAGTALPYDEINPYPIRDAVAPHIGAAAQAIEISPTVVSDAHRRVASRHDLVVAEGAGGWLLPLGPSLTLADLVVDAGWPVVLVVGMRLGCLNHALLAEASIAARTRLLGWVANCLPPRQARLEENIEALAARIRAPLLGVTGPADAAYPVPGPPLSLDPLLKRLK